MAKVYFFFFVFVYIHKLCNCLAPLPVVVGLIYSGFMFDRRLEDEIPDVGKAPGEMTTRVQNG